MQLTTVSEVISFVGELEDTTAKFYEEIAEKYPEGEDIFLSLAKENKKNKLLIQRVYNEVVSDALETGFSFEDLGVDDYLIEINLAEGVSLPNVLKKALDIEEKIQKFYLKAARVSKSFLADVPRVFEKIGKKRDERREKLKSLS